MQSYLSYTSSAVTLNLWKNDETQSFCEAHATTSNYEVGVCEAIVELNQEDTVTVKNRDSGAKIHSRHVEFSGILIFVS